MGNTITLTCARGSCGKIYTRALNEHTRSVRLGRKEYCGRSCAVSAYNKGNVHNLRKGGSAPDAKSPFRWFMRVIRDRRGKKGETDIDLEFLKNLWEEQCGVCPLTGWCMYLPISTRGWPEGSKSRRASLDRIDSSKGYTKDNVRYICVMANYAKNVYTDQDVIEFCDAVHYYNKQ